MPALAQRIIQLCLLTFKALGRLCFGAEVFPYSIELRVLTHVIASGFFLLAEEASAQGLLMNQTSIQHCNELNNIVLQITLFK